MGPRRGAYRIWPLYGAGLESPGVDDQPIAAALPQVGPDQLLVRHDACRLGFSDIKVIYMTGQAINVTGGQEMG